MILIIKHISYEGPGTIEEFFKTQSFHLETVELSKGELLPSDLSGIEAVVSMGGPMNANEEDKYSFLKSENIFIKRVLKEEIPFLGICLGAQLLAKAAGAKVTKAPKEEIGWFKVNLTQDGKKDSLFKSLNEKMTVFQWHADTFAIPESGKHLAESIDCQHQAFKVGSCAYGLQFHIEVTKDIITDWVSQHFKDIQGHITQEGQQMVNDYTKLEKSFNKNADIMYTNFLSLIKNKMVASV